MSSRFFPRLRGMPFVGPLFLVGALLAGCTLPSVPDRSEDGPIAAGRGRLYFYRTALSLGGPNSLLGDASKPAVMLDDRKIADALPGGVFFCDVPPGRHEVAVAGPKPTTILVNVSAGGASYVRMDWGIPIATQRPVLEVDAHTGQMETENRSRIAAACPA